MMKIPYQTPLHLKCTLINDIIEKTINEMSRLSIVERKQYMKIKKILCLLISGMLSLCGCAGSEKTSVMIPEDDVSTTDEFVLSEEELRSSYITDDNARVFYEIFVGSFSDSNGDGIGDLRGIIERFDYLNDGDPDSGRSLGVEGIWLTPIFKSPSYHKYDVEDYYAIDKSFGTEDDLRELISLCHERNVKIILDLPINHTSIKNTWYALFAAARQNKDVSSEYYDLYSCSDSASSDGRIFSKISGTEEYYECNFSADMPELDFSNGSVVEKMKQVAEYYLDMGVDGFRFDAAKYIFLGEEKRNVEFWNDYIGYLREKNSDIFTVAEVWAHDSITEPYFTATNCFDFTMSQLSGQVATTAKGGDVNSYTAYIEQYLSGIRAQNSDAMMIPFVANHDMDRAAGFLTVASGEMKMAANLYLLAPGAPFIYYGEEIGMKGSRGSANTDANRRLAMLWGDGDTVSDPEGTTYTSDKQINGTVSEQLPDADSLYNHYKKLIMIRKAYPEISRGKFTALCFDGMKLGGFVSEYNDSRVAVIHNTTQEEISVDISNVSDIGFSTVCTTAGAGEAALEGSVLTLSGQTSVIIR